MLSKLKYKAKRNEIEDMIWEVDEDCDKAVSWDEFQLMFHRCRIDKVCLPHARDVIFDVPYSVNGVCGVVTCLLLVDLTLDIPTTDWGCLTSYLNYVACCCFRPGLSLANCTMWWSS